MKKFLLPAVLSALLFGHSVSAATQKVSFRILQPPVGFFFSNLALSADGEKMAINTGSEIFLWTAGKGYTDLGPGGTSSGSIAISSDGTTIVADGIGVDGLDSPSRWTASTGWIDLGHPHNGCSLGGSWGSGFGVSGNGAVAVGLSWDCFGKGEGFRWDSYRGMMNLGHPNGASSRASAISADASTIVGFFESPTQGFRRAIRWLSGKKDFIAGAQNPGEATAVSSDGTQIAGQATLGTNLPYAFYFTDKGGLISLGSISGNTCDPSFANGISDNGKVVGFSGDQFFCSGTEAFIWDVRSPHLRPQSIARYLAQRGVKLPAGMTLTTALAISADGSTVVGQWQDVKFHVGTWIAKLK